MCAGKALLASELHRAMSISTRFKVIKVLGEGGILDFVMHRLEEGKDSFFFIRGEGEGKRGYSFASS